LTTFQDGPDLVEDSESNFIITRIQGALKSFVGWIATKFIEDDQRWDDITNSIVSEMRKLLNDLVPAIVDRLRNAINIALTGNELFAFDEDLVDEEEV
jgi:hypothetical protein